MPTTCPAQRIERRPPPLRTPDLTAQILATLEPTMSTALLPSSTVLATFVARNDYNADGLPLRIEVRPRMTPLGYVGKGFEVYCGEYSIDIGGDTALGTIRAALDHAEASGWEGFAVTAEGLAAVGNEVIADLVARY